LKNRSPGIEQRWDLASAACSESGVFAAPLEPGAELVPTDAQKLIKSLTVLPPQGS